MEGMTSQLWGGPEVSDRSQDYRRHKDFGKAMREKDREDISTDPSRVTNPRDKNFLKTQKSLDLKYLPGYTAPLFFATTEQQQQPGRASSEEKYKLAVKGLEKYTKH